MLNQVHRGFIRLAIPLLLAVLGCSLSPELALPTSEPDYRYDDLPSPANESALIEEYRAISRWSTVDIAFTIVNGTGKLEGDSEREIIRQAFDL